MPECARRDLQESGDRLLIAWHLIDSNFIQWSSSRYREAKRNEVESLAILLEGGEGNPYISFAYWLSQFILPWTLLFLGEWGEALAEIRAGFSMAEKNGYHYRGHSLRLDQAWVHLNAMDFAGVVGICESVLPVVEEPGRGPWRRFALILAGSAQTARGNYESAHKYLSTAMDEMDHQKLIFDWYFRMLLESALTELWLAKADLPGSGPKRRGSSASHWRPWSAPGKGWRGKRMPESQWHSSTLIAREIALPRLS